MRSLPVLFALLLTASLTSVGCSSTSATTVDMDMKPRPELTIYVMPIGPPPLDTSKKHWALAPSKRIGNTYPQAQFRPEDYLNFQRTLVDSLQETEAFLNVQPIHRGLKPQKPFRVLRVVLADVGADDRGITGVKAWLRGRAQIEDDQGRIENTRDISAYDESTFGSMGGVKGEVIEQFVSQVGKLVDGI